MKASFYTTEQDISEFIKYFSRTFSCFLLDSPSGCQTSTNSNCPDLVDLVNYLQRQKKNSEVLDVNTIKSLVFPQSQFDFFVSHYHKNCEIAKEFSDKLYRNLKFSSFIDSQYWGKVTNLYQSYEKTFLSEFHNVDVKEQMEFWTNISMILVSSLMEMINSTDYFIFIDEQDNFDKIGKSIDVFSPWVHLELMCSNLFKVQPDLLPVMESYKIHRNLKYTTHCDHIIKVTSENLISAFELAVNEKDVQAGREYFIDQLIKTATANK